MGSLVAFKQNSFDISLYLHFLLPRLLWRIQNDWPTACTFGATAADRQWSDLKAILHRLVPKGMHAMGTCRNDYDGHHFNLQISHLNTLTYTTWGISKACSFILLRFLTSDTQSKALGYIVNTAGRAAQYTQSGPTIGWRTFIVCTIPENCYCAESFLVYLSKKILCVCLSLDSTAQPKVKIGLNEPFLTC